MKKVSLISSLLLLIAISGLLFGMPAYEVYQTKSVLTEVINHGYEESKKIDQFIETNDLFPTVKEMKKANLLTKNPHIAFKFVKNDDKNQTGVLEITLKETGVPSPLSNQKIFFELTENGWKCSTLLEQKYRIESCNADAPPQPVYLG